MDDMHLVNVTYVVQGNYCDNKVAVINAII